MPAQVLHFPKGLVPFRFVVDIYGTRQKITLDDFKLYSYQICCRHLFFKVRIYFSITILVNY